MKSKENLEEILKQEATRTAFVPTNHGAMKVKYQNHLFVHHFTRNRIARYRCEHFDKKKCSAIVFVKEGFTYPHNHHSH